MILNCISFIIRNICAKIVERDRICMLYLIGILCNKGETRVTVFIIEGRDFKYSINNMGMAIGYKPFNN